MKVDKTLVASVALHVLVIGWGLVSFSTKAFESIPEETLPVDIISSDQLAKVTAGMKTGKKENPKPLVEKVAEAKPADDAVGKISEKPPVVTDTSPPPVPKVEDKPVEKKPDPPKPVAEAKPKEEPKPIEKKPDPPKIDPIAEALKKEEKKPPPKPQARAAPPPQPPKPKAERTFDQSKIAALLDKRDPTRRGADRRHAEFQRGARTCSWQGRRQFRHLGFDVQGTGRALLEETVWRHREPESGSRIRDQAEAGRYAGKRAGRRRLARDAISARLSGERAARDHRVPALSICLRPFSTSGNISRRYLPNERPEKRPQSSGRKREMKRLNNMIDKDGLRQMPFRPSRRQIISGMAALGALSGSGVRHAFAQGGPKRIVVPEGEFTPLPIAIPNFVPGTPSDDDVAVGVTQVITNNLKRSGLFAPIDQAAYIEHVTNIDVPPQFANWKTINAQALVTGRMTRQGDGRLKAEFRLWDVATGQQLTGQQYFTSPEYWRRIAHIISDQIYERLTGEKGYFDSRVVFVDESGAAQHRIKRLGVDGSGRRQCTLSDPGSDLVLTPRFSPSTQEITYMEFGQGDPRVYLLNIETGQREIVGNFPGMSFSPRFSPDGQRIIMSLAAGRQFEPVRDGFAFEIDHPTDRYAGDRYLAVLCARRRAAVF